MIVLIKKKMHDKVEIIHFKINEKQYFSNYKISENTRSIYKQLVLQKKIMKKILYLYLVCLLVEVK
jgi:hypothetical protein